VLGHKVLAARAAVGPHLTCPVHDAHIQYIRVHMLYGAICVCKCACVFVGMSVCMCARVCTMARLDARALSREARLRVLCMHIIYIHVHI